MSEVTNLLLAFSILEDIEARVDDVNGWLASEEQLPLGNVWRTERVVGGGKRMETPLYAGAFNAIDLQAFLAFLRSVAWSQPDEVQVMFHGQDDTRWQIIDA